MVAFFQLLGDTPARFVSQLIGGQPCLDLFSIWGVGPKGRCVLPNNLTNTGLRDTYFLCANSWFRISSRNFQVGYRSVTRVEVYNSFLSTLDWAGLQNGIRQPKDGFKSSTLFTNSDLLKIVEDWIISFLQFLNFIG